MLGSRVGPSASINCLVSRARCLGGVVVEARDSASLLLARPRNPSTQPTGGVIPEWKAQW